MAGFATRDAIIAANVAGKVDRTDALFLAAGFIVGGWVSGWTSTAGAAPATTPGVTYSIDQNSSLAAQVANISLPDRSTDQKYLIKAIVTPDNDGSSQTMPFTTVILYDRLAAVGAVAVSTTGAKTINSAALPRYSGTAADRNEVWLEFTAGSGSGGIYHLSSYTTADGTTAQTGGTATVLANTGTNTMMQLPLNDSKRGVRSVETLTVDTLTTSGVCNVVILRPLVVLRCPPGGMGYFNFVDDIMNPVRIFDDACICTISRGGGIGKLLVTLSVAYG